MVTAILPSLTDEHGAPAPGLRKPAASHGRPSVTLSVDSEVTITPERFRNSSSPVPPYGDEAVTTSDSAGKPSVLAGYVGLFTGCGALVALSLFLPLPARFGRIEGVTLADAVKDSYYVVGLVSFLVAIFVSFGLRGLKGEEGKGWRMLLTRKGSTPDDASSESALAPKTVSSLPSSPPTAPNIPSKTVLPYWHLLRASIRLGFTDSSIALGYLGGFIARASTVAISLFLPLYVNTFFFRNGFCQGSPHDPSPDLKKECRQAYVLASILTGVAQLVGLLCAPLFGYLSSRRQGRVNWPIVASTVLGIVGYLAFPRLPSPEFRDVDGRGGGPAVFFLAALIGASQIGAIVCSLGSLGRGVLKVEHTTPANNTPRGETAPLLYPRDDPETYDDTNSIEDDEEEDSDRATSRVRLKGSVAGVYSWCGGAAILLLTKLGGWLFDAWSTGAPFYLMAGFNAVLLVASLAIDVGRARGKGAVPARARG